jgi:hypothetical protein
VQPAAAQQAPPAEEDAAMTGFEDAMRGAENAFLYGDFDEVVARLEPVLLPTAPDVEDERVLRGYTLLGVSAQFEDALALADTAYLAALRLDPLFRLDPLMFPPAVIERFEAVRESNRAELDALVAPSEQRPTLYVVERIETQPLAVSVLPFGIGFLASERYGAGSAYLVAQATSTALMTSMYLANEYGRNADGSFDDASRAQRRGTVQRASAGALVALVLTNMIHGGLSHAATRRVSYRTLSEPPPAMRPPQSRSPRRWQLRVAPLLVSPSL